MKICRFDDNRIGLVQADGIHDVTSVASDLGSFTYPLPRYDPFIASLQKLRGKIETAAKSTKESRQKRSSCLLP